MMQTDPCKLVIIDDQETECQPLVEFTRRIAPAWNVLYVPDRPLALDMLSRNSDIDIILLNIHLDKPSLNFSSNPGPTTPIQRWRELMQLASNRDIAIVVITKRQEYWLVDEHGTGLSSSTLFDEISEFDAQLWFKGDYETQAEFYQNQLATAYRRRQELTRAPTDLTERDFVRVREYLAHHVAWNNRSRAQRIDYIQTALSPFTRLQQYPSFASDPLTAADAAIRFLEDIGYIYKHPGRSALGCLIERFYNEEPGKLKNYFDHLIRSYRLILRWNPRSA